MYDISIYNCRLLVRSGVSELGRLDELGINIINPILYLW